MIGSFWNLCRACPSMPVDKQLHSEYRSTYRWHEYTGSSRPEVVRRAPIPNKFGPTNEPPLPRRKKCPELAYKSHEFIIMSEKTPETRCNDNSKRARAEERGTPPRRSKSEGPPATVNGTPFAIVTDNTGTCFGKSFAEPGESSGLFKNNIAVLSTEYRLQFVWPKVHKSLNEQLSDAVEVPKKSKSMGAIKSSQSTSMPTVHKKRTTYQKEATLHELEPLVAGEEDDKPTENTKLNRQLVPNINQEQKRVKESIRGKKNVGHLEADKLVNDRNNYTKENGVHSLYQDEWYKDVVELRKKAGEYKCRGWGVEIDPTIFKKQKDIWDQVSKRSSLSALSLASSTNRKITKEEKEQQNKMKFIPSKKINKQKAQGIAYFNDSLDEFSLPARNSNIRHHLERTTGTDAEEGVLIPSPTREKLMPAIPKPKEPESQRGSPKKTAVSRHVSPQKGSPQKGSPKKTTKDDGDCAEKEVGEMVSNYISQRAPGIPYEPIIKSPPEPTRVKSPEQIIMRSPDPVNWTVPLDTGKTFTVTQKVKEGENYSRPQSEIKASTPIQNSRPAPQSAPPELIEPLRMAWKKDDIKSSTGSKINLFSCGSKDDIHHLDKPVTVLNIHCSDDTTLESDILKQTASSNATDVLEKARDRFDRFWENNQENNV